MPANTTRREFLLGTAVTTAVASLGTVFSAGVLGRAGSELAGRSARAPSAMAFRFL